MASSTRLLGILKKQLKKQGITYRQLAEKLSLSESAIKQMFAGDNMTLKRLDSICDVLQLDIADLVSISLAEEDKVDMLSLQQEEELITDPKLLVVTYCTVNDWTFERMFKKYTFSEPELIRYLAKLDKMGLIELLPSNRIRTRISHNFAWQSNGPIERYFRAEVQNRFFNSQFGDDDSLRVVKNGDISIAGRQQLVERLNGIGQLFDDILHQERKLTHSNRQGTSMVLAVRHWQFEAFRNLERMPD